MYNYLIVPHRNNADKNRRFLSTESYKDSVFASKAKRSRVLSQSMAHKHECALGTFVDGNPVGIAVLLKQKRSRVLNHSSLITKPPLLSQGRFCALSYRAIYGINAINRARLIAVASFLCILLDTPVLRVPFNRAWGVINFLRVSTSL